MGARETNVSEEETESCWLAPAESGGRESQQLPSIWQQGSSLLHPRKGQSPEASYNQCLDSGSGGEMERDGCRPDAANAVRAERPPTCSTNGGGTMCRSRCSRRQLTQFLKEGSECFNPEEVAG